MEPQLKDGSARNDALWKMYEEHARQARQHEDQRERMTYIVLVVSSALIAFVAHNGLLNSSRCIKTEVDDGHDCYGSLYSPVCRCKFFSRLYCHPLTFSLFSVTYISGRIH